MHAVYRYLSGDRTAENAAVQRLCWFGWLAARRFGLQPRDADEAGVDFAAHMMADGARRLRPCRDDLNRFIQIRASRFAADRSRVIRARTRLMNDQPLEEETCGSAQPDPLSAILARESIDRVAAISKHLSEEDYQLLQWTVLDGLTSRESAERLSCTPAAVRKRLERMRIRLIKLLS